MTKRRKRKGKRKKKGYLQPNKEPIPRSVKEKVRKRSGNTCEMLGCTTKGTRFRPLTFHHVSERRVGGYNTADNLRHYCRDCHLEIHRPKK